jgi:hypothetical protein
VVVSCAPRLDARLIAAIANLDNRNRPIAETYRGVAAVAEGLGLLRPSYEQVRRLIHEIRGRRRDPVIGQLLLDIASQRRPPEALVAALAGNHLPRLP